MFHHRVDVDDTQGDPAGLIGLAALGAGAAVHRDEAHDTAFGPLDRDQLGRRRGRRQAGCKRVRDGCLAQGLARQIEAQHRLRDSA